MQNLLERELAGRIRLYLLDISQPLLGLAHKHATETFLGNPYLMWWYRTRYADERKARGRRHVLCL